MERSIFELSIDGEELTRVLAAVPPGDIITWDTLSEAIGRNVRNEARGVLDAARVRVQTQSGIVFETVRGVGLKHQLKPEVAIGALPEANKKITAVCKRTKRKQKTISDADYAKLTKEQQTAFNTGRAYIGVFAEMVKTRSVTRVERAVANAGHALPLAATLAHFTNRKSKT